MAIPLGTLATRQTSANAGFSRPVAFTGASDRSRALSWIHGIVPTVSLGALRSATGVIHGKLKRSPKFGISILTGVFVLCDCGGEHEDDAFASTIVDLARGGCGFAGVAGSPADEALCGE
jgi:hypothetical protein